MRQVGMDEKSFGKGQSYVSLLTDLDRARVPFGRLRALPFDRLRP